MLRWDVRSEASLKLRDDISCFTSTIRKAAQDL